MRALHSALSKSCRCLSRHPSCFVLKHYPREAKSEEPHQPAFISENTSGRTSGGPVAIEEYDAQRDSSNFGSRFSRLTCMNSFHRAVIPNPSALVSPFATTSEHLAFAIFEKTHATASSTLSDVLPFIVAMASLIRCWDQAYLSGNLDTSPPQRRSRV